MMSSTIYHNTSNSSINQSDEDANCLFAMKLATGAVLPMVLKSAIELNLLELIKKAGPTAFVSASELASQLPTTNPNAASMIDRILHLLSAHSILVCTLKPLPKDRVERRYSLAPVCKFLTKNEDGVSLSTLLLFHNDRVTMEIWYHLKDAVIEGGNAFNRAYGINVFESHSIHDLSYNETFNRAMSDNSNIFTKKIIEAYKGFEGLKSLVDVGGGTGATISTIISKYPSIKGFNFDLPQVIQEAPAYPGVEHIGGDMFVSVPKADAIFMKGILHDWGDEQCQKLLKNCYESLPINGKVIIVEFLFSEEPNSGMEYSWVAVMDLVMMAITSSGKERTEKEFQELAKSAGFTKFIKVSSAFSAWIMELYK